MKSTAKPPPLPEDVRAQVPRGIERLLLRLLEKSPANRPASADEVVTALEPFVTAVGVPSPIPAARTPSSSASMPVAVPAARTGPRARLDTIALIQAAHQPPRV